MKMVTKPPPEVLTTEKLSFMSTLSEYQRRRFLATEALALGRRGVDKVSQFVGASKNTLYNGIKEIKADYTPDRGRVRRPGGGRKALLRSLSIDTKKKELIGNFKRDGKVFCTASTT